MECDDTVITEIFSQPGYSFLANNYYLMYHSFMPNCRLTITKIRQHYDLPDDIEKNILDSSIRRIRCQRLLHFLLATLNTDKDYMKFCYLLFLSTVLTDLPCKMISLFKINGNWDCTTKVHPELKSLYMDYQVAKGQRPSNSTKFSFHNDDVAPSADCDDEIDLQFASGCDTLRTAGSLYNRRQYSLLLHTQPTTTEEKHNSLVHIGKFQNSSQLVTEVDSGAPKLQFDMNAARSILVAEESGNHNNNNLLQFSSITFDIINNTDLTEHISTECNPVSSKTSGVHLAIHSKPQAAISSANTCVKADITQQTVPIDKPNCAPLKLPSFPDVLKQNKNLQILQSKYASILQSFPSTHFSTLECLQDYLTDECLGECVMIESDAQLANQIMLDCMISKIGCKEDLLDFFDHLEEITDAHDLFSIVNQLRKELQNIFEKDDLNIQPTLSNSKSETVLRDSRIDTALELKSWVLLQTSLSDKCKDLLKRHYQALCGCLPRDVQKTKSVLLQAYSLPSCAIEKITPSISPEVVNQKIVNFLITSCKSDEEIIDFCDLFEKLIENPLFVPYIEMLRNDFLMLEWSEQCSVATATTSATTTTTSLTSGLPQQSIQSEKRISAAQLENQSTTAVQNGVLLKDPNSKEHLASQLKYEQCRLQKGFKYCQPPPKPAILIQRKELLSKLATVLINSNIDPNDINPTVVVTGVGGFGKTTLVKALCYLEMVEAHFTDGFLFIEIGQQADPASQLHQLYSLLNSGNSFPRGNLVNVIEAVRKLTHSFYRKLLVLIDDVWKIEDAEPMLKAFRSCKTILTSRNNNICQFINPEGHITVESMTNLEAADLLTTKIINLDQLSESVLKRVNDLAQDVHLWPLLLSLVRGQIKCNQSLYNHSFEKAIQNVQERLLHKGLTAFDKNCLDRSKGRNYAVKVCVEASLDLLQDTEKDKLKTLILFTGIGSSVPVSVLHLLWQARKEEAEASIEKMWAYGLVMSKELPIPPHNYKQSCAEVHYTISEYIINSLESVEVVRLSQLFDSLTNLTDGLTDAFICSYGCHPSQLGQEEFLLYWKTRLEHDVLTFYLRRINMCAVVDPHKIIFQMQKMQNALTQIPGAFYIVNEFKLIQDKSKVLLKKASRSSQELNQVVLNCLYENNYKGLISALHIYCTEYEVGKVASKSVELCLNVINSFGKQAPLFFVELYERMQRLTPEYHEVTGTAIVQARIELHLDLHKQIISALNDKSASQIQAINDYVKSGNFHEEEDLINIHYLIKLKRVAPHLIQ